MTPPKSKEKCCKRCSRGAYPCGNSSCLCHAIQQQCHQRPESEVPRYKQVQVKITSSSGNGYIGQRPESDWRKAFGNKFNIAYVHDKGFAFLGVEICDFFAEYIETAYQRGQQDANTRLLENNRTLQAKLREGDRRILKELLAFINRHSGVTSIGIVDHIHNLLSFQQEPQDH